MPFLATAYSSRAKSAPVYWSAAPPSMPVRFGVSRMPHPPYTYLTTPSPRVLRELGPGRRGPKADDAPNSGREGVLASFSRSIVPPRPTLTPSVPGKPLSYLRICAKHKYGDVPLHSVPWLWQACLFTSGASALRHANPLDCGILTSRQTLRRTMGSSAVLRPGHASRVTSIGSSPHMPLSAIPNRTFCGLPRSTPGRLNRTSKTRSRSHA